MDSAGRDLVSSDVSAVADTSLAVALPESRVDSDADIEAVIRKSRLHKSPKHTVLKFMSEMPKTTIAKIVKEHEHRDSAVAEIHALIGRKQVFLLRGDQSLTVKRQALQHLFQWTAKNHGEETLTTLRRIL